MACGPEQAALHSLESRQQASLGIFLKPVTSRILNYQRSAFVRGFLKLLFLQSTLLNLLTGIITSVTK